MDVKVRRAVPADAASLSNIAYRAKASWGYPAAWLEIWRGELVVTPEYLEIHEGFVALRDLETIGACVLEDAGGAWRLEHFWIEPAWHGRGVGQLLLQHARAAMNRRYGGSCEIVSDPNAEAFYLRLGAVRVCTIAAPMPGAPDRVLPILRLR
jgi:GNAT superfamily N-acetyltransferase